MKLEHLHEHVTAATAVLVGAFVAYWFGLLASEGSTGTVVGVLAGFLFTMLVLGLRQNIWVLIPLTAAFSGALPQLKFNPGLHDVVILGVGLAMFTLIAFKIVRRKPKFNTVDFWLWAALLYLLTVYLRHPAGGLVLNSDRIGGRAYLMTALNVVAYWVLARTALPPGWMTHWMILGLLCSRWGQGFLIVLTHWSPQMAMMIGPYYSGVDTSAFETDDDPVGDPGDAPNRQGYMQDLGEPVARWLMARYGSFTLINPLYFFRCGIFFASSLACMMAGFRSTLMGLGGYFLIASYLRRGWFEVGRAVMLGFLAVLLIGAASYFIHLPLPIQRTLSFLPGQWDAAAVADAQASSAWRFYMWREMLSSDRYIENKWLGDGFGFSMSQFLAMGYAKAAGDIQENFMIVGQVHSGPITTIRYVGVVGLLIHICLLVAMAREALAICRASQNTQLAALSLFLCLPIIWEPVNYLFIFGSYDNSLPGQIYWAGLLKMLRNSLELHQAVAAAPVAVPRAAARVRRPSLPRHWPLPHAS